MFDVAATAYDRFMGRWARLLAPQLADLAGVSAGQRVLDVGCGPGALTSVLVERVGADHVAAVDPSAPFMAATRERLPGADVRLASAEALPFPDDSFDAALAQLVVHFMSDPVAGLREMARVTRTGGVVAACVWDIAGERDPQHVFWAAARAVDPGVRDESRLAGARAGHLEQLLDEAGLTDVVGADLVIHSELAGFEAWWDPFTEGVGPAGAFLAGLDAAGREVMRETCRARLPSGPFVLEAHAWAARGVAGRDAVRAPSVARSG